ncbi:hypothetical protein ACFOGJ_22820 [Marinibaculum pumilum]|uniref:Yip1 domain-containing protein n=1 Tax=Marinibaculum pumilum TaxID=1766165 RepID=A0ABV7L758_9PROT
MPDWPEVRRNLHAAWRLAHGEAAAMGRFDVTADGFYRSFGVWAFVIPVQILLVLAIAEPGRGDALGLALVEALLFVVAWILYAVTAALLLQQTGRGRSFAGFMIAYNWAQALLTLVVVPIFLLLALGGLNTGLAALLYWLLQLAIVAYIGVIARAATGAGIAICLTLALLDQVIFRLVFAAGQDLLLGG